jgi:signal transduction histidine kinase
MRRFFFITALIAPALLLLFFWLFPELDLGFRLPLFHFYVVTFTTFAAAVVSILLVIMLQSVAQLRHALAALAFAVMGTVFFTHGLPTPGALMSHFHPAVQWSAWLTLFSGGLVFYLATYDQPQQRPSWLSLTTVIYFAAIGVTLYLAIILLVPHWLQMIDEQIAPWHRLVAFYLTLLLWLGAGMRLWRTWQLTRSRVDGVLVLVAFWLAQAAISMHQFPLWQLSWWLYHFLLLVAFLLTLRVLIMQYEQAHQFRLLPYYLATSLIVTAFLALVSAYLYGDFVATLLGLVVTQEMIFQGRVVGLSIATLSMGTLFLVLFFVVRRADRIMGQNAADLARAYENLRRSEQSRQDLTNMIVHDLRTPLTSISVSLDLAARDRAVGNAEMQAKFMDRIGRAATRLSRMVDDILAVSKLEAGEFVLELEWVRLHSFLAERLEGFSAQAVRENKVLHLDCALGLTAEFDTGLLGRVIENLVANAIRYTTDNGQIHVAAWHHDERVWLAVRDNGIGIPEAYHERIFDKYVQAPAADNETLRKGTGLGLAFCRLVVEAHNGRIWVENNAPAGSTFRMWLPQAKMVSLDT